MTAQSELGALGDSFIIPRTDPVSVGPFRCNVCGASELGIDVTVQEVGKMTIRLYCRECNNYMDASLEYSDGNNN